MAPLMNGRRAVLGAVLAGALCFGVPTPSAAQDSKPTKKKISKREIQQAKRKLFEASRIATSDARKAEGLALEAVKIYPDYEQARSFLGWLYNVRLGENSKAIEQYDHLIRTTKNKKIKADALANKGSLIFVEKRDAETAIDLYNAAYRLYRIWEYPDKASNLCLHIGKVKRAHSNAERAYEILVRYLKRLKKAVDASSGTSKRKLQQTYDLTEPNLVKVKIQLATCKILMGKRDEAKKLMEGVEEFPRGVKYNLAIYRAVNGQKQGALNCLQDFMLTRKTPHARNLLRQFIREEPSFKDFLKDPEFKKFATDEPEKKKKDEKK